MLVAIVHRHISVEHSPMVMRIVCQPIKLRAWRSVIFSCRQGFLIRVQRRRS